MDEETDKPFRWEVCPITPDAYDEDSTFFRDAGTSLSGKTQYIDCYVCQQDRWWIGTARVEPYCHCQNETHIQYMKEAMVVQHKQTKKLVAMVRAASAFEPRILQLGHVTWQNDLRAMLVPYHELGGDQEAAVDYVKVEQKLGKYELRGIVGLLQLVAWKAAIFSQHHPSEIFDFLEFHRRGWKKHKENMRCSNGIAIVVRSVMPFLENPPNDGSPPPT